MPRKSDAAPRSNCSPLRHLEHELESRVLPPARQARDDADHCVTSSRACSRRGRYPDAERRGHVDRPRAEGPASGGVLTDGSLRAARRDRRAWRRTFAGERGPVRGLRVSCGEIRPMRTARCGSADEGSRSRGLASSGRRRSARTSRIVSFPHAARHRHRAGRNRKKPREGAPTRAAGSPSATTGGELRRSDVSAMSRVRSIPSRRQYALSLGDGEA